MAVDGGIYNPAPVTSAGTDIAALGGEGTSCNNMTHLTTKAGVWSVLQKNRSYK